MMNTVKDQLILVSWDTAYGDAYAFINSSCISALQIYSTKLADNYEIEALHQVRVALRRLDCSLSFYNDVFRLDHSVKRELKFFRKKLSIVRDYDVLLDSTLPTLIKKKILLKEIGKFTAHVNLKIKNKHQEISSIIRSNKTQNLLKNLEAELIHKPKLNLTQRHRLGVLDENFKKIASIKLSEQHFELMKTANKFDLSSQSDLHALRKKIRQFRYTSDFMKNVFPQEKITPFLKRLGENQVFLGKINDLYSAVKLITKSGGHKNKFFVLASKIQSIIESKSKKRQKKFSKLWSKYAQLDPFW